MKKLLSVVLILSILFSFAASFGASAETPDVSDDELINGIVSYFMPLTEIPRQSHHEEKISEYLYSWAKERGFNPVQDDVNNVIFDVPGTKGMENAPITILQAHMDMVIAVKDGKTFDPQKDGIKVINDGITLTADGTSLGADDGMGVATILYIIENNKSHGPLRIIFTTNEEDGMTGAFGLSEEDTKDVKYVMNLDSENSKEVTNSSAAGTTVRFSMDAKTSAPTKKQAYEISLTGLQSGHSGIDIDKGRLNAIKTLSYILGKFKLEEMDFELASIVGGSANNAIPAKATAIAVFNEEDEAKLEESFKQVIDFIDEFFGDIEPNYSLTMKKCDMPDKVIEKETQQNVMIFLTELFDGVNSWSKAVEGLVESSSNLGLTSINANSGEKFTASTYIRSSDKDYLKSLTDDQVKLGEKCGFNVESAKTADPWPVKTDSTLLEMIKSAYLKETGTEISVVQLHAGLETGTFSLLNPDLDIVSIGFDIKNPHTIDETCYIQTIPTTYRVIETVLSEIGNETVTQQNSI